MSFTAVEQAIADIRAGKLVIVADDERRENEGDLIGAAEKVTPEMINFMATHARGLICMPLTPERCQALGLPQMTEHNNESHETAFTISIDAAARLALAAAMAVLQATVLYALLRRLGMRARDALACSALSLTFPFSDSVWLWGVLSLASVAIAASLLG